MDKVSFGKTGIMASRLGLGTVKFGRNTGVKYPEGFTLPSEESLADLLTLAKNLGLNLLDTAPAYGASEERLGRLLKGQRADWVIIGKAGEDFENNQSSYDFAPDAIRRSLERSLKRLQTDYLDVILLHSDGRDLDILADEALIKTLLDLKAQGLVRAVGASTKTAAGGIKALELLDVVMATYTPEYTAERPVLDYAAALGKGVILKKALSSGHDTNVEAALRHAFAHPATASVIIGTITPEHLKQNVEIFRNLRKS